MRFFNIHSVAKHEKIEEFFFYFRDKISQCRKKLKGFSNIHSVAKHLKNAGGTLRGKKISKKNVSQCRKKFERGDSLVLPGMICYAEKQVKPFWSSSLGQMVLFDTIIFCRTFKNYFGQFVWIEKKRVTISRVSLHEAPTKNGSFFTRKVHFFVHLFNNLKPQQLQTASKTKRKNKTDVHNLENTLKIPP